MANPHLPLLETARVERSVEEIEDRTLVLQCVTACAYGFDRQRAMSWLEREARKELLTPVELQFLETGMGNRQQLMFQVEALFALAWSISLTPSLAFDKYVPETLIDVFPGLEKVESSLDFRRAARLRDQVELVEALDLAYCLHWAVRDSQLRGGRSQAPVEPYVVVERRRALEWLFCEDPWEEITLDT